MLSLTIFFLRYLLGDPRKIRPSHLGDHERSSVMVGDNILLILTGCGYRIMGPFCPNKCREQTKVRSLMSANVKSCLARLINHLEAHLHATGVHLPVQFLNPPGSFRSMKHGFGNRMKRTPGWLAPVLPGNSYD